MTSSMRPGTEGQAGRDLSGIPSSFERHKALMEGLLPAGPPHDLDPEAVARLQEAGRLLVEVVERLARAGVRPPGLPSGSPWEQSHHLPVEDAVVQDLMHYFLEANLVMARHLLASPAMAVRSPDPEAELPEAETEVLRSVGASFSPLGEEDEDPELAYEASYARMLATALDTKEAAERLGNVSDGYVRQRLESGTLYGVKLGRAWRLPLFQFTGSGEVPGVKEVLPLLDPKLNPVAVERWFALPKPELYDEERGRELSPREWLLSGHGPEHIKPLAGDL